jgi:hypothetical protein
MTRIIGKPSKAVHFLCSGNDFRKKNRPFPMSGRLAGGKAAASFCQADAAGRGETVSLVREMISCVRETSSGTQGRLAADRKPSPLLRKPFPVFRK